MNRYSAGLAGQELPRAALRGALWVLEQLPKAFVITVHQLGPALPRKPPVPSLVLEVLVMGVLIVYCYTYNDKKTCSVLNIIPAGKRDR